MFASDKFYHIFLDGAFILKVVIFLNLPLGLFFFYKATFYVVKEDDQILQ